MAIKNTPGRTRWSEQSPISTGLGCRDRNTRPKVEHLIYNFLDAELGRIHNVGTRRRHERGMSSRTITFIARTQVRQKTRKISRNTLFAQLFTASLGSHFGICQQKYL